MTKNLNNKNRIKTIAFLLIILIPSLFTVFPIKTNDPGNNFNNISQDIENDPFHEPVDNIKSPKSSIISNDPWWNGSWRYRQLINITNPNLGITFQNYTTTLVFNYTEPIYENKMNGDLSDIRIVQNGKLKKYWYKLDYPEPDLATVWFDVDINQSPNNIDTEHTFLYFNGSSMESTDPDYFMDTPSNNRKDAFGGIRNGNFEIAPSSPPDWQRLTDEVYGWTYSNVGVYDDASGDTSNYQHNLTTWNIYQSRVFDDYSFKWGDIDHYLADGELDDNDFEGTLYSYPFVVPTLSGTEFNLGLSIYRNVRFYNTKSSHLMGFFVRLSSGELYSSDVLSHDELYLKEKWQTSSSGATWATYGTMDVDTRNQEGDPPYSNDGGLTGTITINMNNYMGELVFLEVGTYGKESKFQTAFAQIDNIKFNYELETALNVDIQEVAGEATFITKDVDGRIVPNAEVTIMEEYGDPTEIGPYETTEEDGSVSFSNVPYGLYNVTVNYTIPSSGLEGMMYDSRTISKEFLIDGSGKVYELILNMSTIDFEVVDYGGYPLTYGYISVSYNEGSSTLDVLQLENDGKATFRWFNRSSYYYQIYYNNSDYSLNPTLLNQSYILRENYAKFSDGEKYQNHLLDINRKNQVSPSSGYFNIKERIYTNGSMTQKSDITLINTTIIIENNEFLDNVSVYYIDSFNKTGTINHRIYFDDSYVGETDDIITIDLMTVVNSKLSAEKRLVYGLYINIWGINSSTCTGNININMSEGWHIYNKTAISKLNIRILGDGAMISDAIVTIKSNSTIYGQIVTTTLISDKDRNSYAFSANDLPFMYLRGYYYNFSARWEGASIQNTFNVSGSDPDQWAPIVPITVPAPVPWYNYSLLKYNFTLEFDIDMGSIDPNEYKIKFDNFTDPEEVVWGNNVTYQIYFNKTEDNWLNYDAVIAPDSIKLKIKLSEVLLFTFNMNPTGVPGNYMIEFNSSILSAGIAGVFYRIVITGSNNPYTLESDEITTLYVSGKSTVLTLHDYKSPTLEEIPENTISERYGELVNITVKFYNDTNNPLTDATIAFDWLNLGYNYTGFKLDPINIGYYTLTLDTQIVELVGTRTIKITATRENYRSQTILISLDILERQTTLNNQTGLVYSNPKIWVQDPHSYNFTYRDTLQKKLIGDLDVAVYSWQKLDESGNVIAGQSGTGSLSQNADNSYMLDFNTELKPVGFFQLYLTFQKQNYEERFALVNLQIQLREFDSNLDVTGLEDDQVTVIKGKDVEFEIELKDTTRGDIPLRGASVILEIGDDEFEFDEDDPGVYTYTFSTKEIEAFYTSQTFTGQIVIEAANFTSEEIDITIVVTMEEISPGVPTFYFIMLVALIAGTIGSLVSYRVIQQARIPKHVKKIRLVKKKIKARDSIPKSISIPTKEQMIMKQYGTIWKELDLSLEDIIGVKMKKTKIISKEKVSIKENGGEE